MNAVENCEEVGEFQFLEESGENYHEALLEKRRQSQAEIKSNLVHESAYTFGLQGENNQTGNSYKHTIFLSASFSYFFCTGNIMMFRKVS